MNALINVIDEKAPIWVKECKWYYENNYREEWIANVDKETKMLIITGCDIGWQEIKLNLEQAEEVYDIIIGVKRASKEFSENPLSKWIFGEGEKLWIASVIHAAKVLM